MILPTQHIFANPDLLKLALTHPSLHKKNNNQRLEFLGDAVLGLVVAELLYGLYPEEAEGELARRHAALVCGSTLAAVARGLELGAHLKMAASEAATGGRENESNLEDACEALIGAIYLDGGLEAAKQFVRKHWAPLATIVQVPPKDAKTALQEWAQGRGLPIPVYTVTETTGPAHAPEFTVEAQVEGYPFVSAKAANKRAAEQTAAKILLERVSV